jgi:hypothetical protein
MKTKDTIASPSPSALSLALRPLLFLDPQDPELHTYAVLDGASIPDLLDHLYGDPRPAFVCLYRGELAPDMAEVAPYLVQLKPETPFTDWLLSEGWGKHWGIFALSSADMIAIRKHFRTFLMVKSPEGKQVYFRYYDPRVLRIFLPTCNSEETGLVFGPVVSYLCEADRPATLLAFGVESGLPQRVETKLVPL